MRVLLSGASGLIGKSLAPFLFSRGIEVIFLVRHPSDLPNTICWNPESENIELSQFEGFDAVIHLAGENIGKRWTKKIKEKIFLSRCRDTQLLVRLLARLKTPPKTFICASAVGYYGNQGDALLTEKNNNGSGFLASLCVRWEAAGRVLEKKGIRVVHTRFGAVLSFRGGMLSKQLPLFRLGLGGKLGSGKQFISWIALEDVVGGIYHVLTHSNLSGAFNFVSPHPVRQVEFAQELANLLHRPLWFNVPAWLIRTFFGEMGDELLLSSSRAIPERLLGSGFIFRYPTLRQCLQAEK